MATGEFTWLCRQYPDFETRDLRPGILLPGFVDTHIHYPQVYVVGSMGLHLLDWLKEHMASAETLLVDPTHARRVAQDSLKLMLRNGTTCALVFGAHFREAQDILFDEASTLGIQLTSGMAMADRYLHQELLQSPSDVYESGISLIERWHGKGRISYAVTPRFALSTSPVLLEVARELLRMKPGIILQTHINETVDEVSAVRESFPWAKDSLAVYEAFDLVGPRSVFAHDVCPTESELQRLAAAHASVAHCPTSNAFLGSGLFPMKVHCEQGVNVALGSDVGAGTGFSLLKEGLMAYEVQMLSPNGYPLTPTHLLYLATAAGARALGVDREVGDLSPGKYADMVLVKPRKGSTLDTVLSHCDSAEEVLGAIFTLAGEDSVAEVFLAGRSAYRRPR